MLNNGPDDFGNTLLSLEVSAPAALVGAWALAPASPKADEYRAMSKSIQDQLRKLIPLQYFQDLKKFEGPHPSAALLVYASLPRTTGIVVEGGGSSVRRPQDVTRTSMPPGPSRRWHVAH